MNLGALEQQQREIVSDSLITVTSRDHVDHADPQWLKARDVVATAFGTINASLLPDRPRAGGINVFTLGCLYDADGHRIDLSQLNGRPGKKNLGLAADPATLPAEVRPDDIPRLQGRTLYLGTFHNHYGHFLTESMSRFWWHEAADSFDHLVAYGFIHNNGRVHVQRFHRHMTGILGIPLKRMELLTAPVRFDEIVVPEQLFIFGSHVNVRAGDIYGRIAEHHRAGIPSGRIFLTKSVHPHARLANAHGVEDVFASFGFRVIYPEEVKIERQLDYYVNSEVIAGLSGSAMHNCLFSRPGTLTIEVGDWRARHEPVKNQVIANDLSRVDARFIPFESSRNREIDLAFVRSSLRDILGERPRLGPLVAVRLKRAAVRWLSPKLAARRRARLPTEGWR
jgi:capsular polysaccharide biosynthesis protein